MNDWKGSGRMSAFRICKKIVSCFFFVAVFFTVFSQSVHAHKVIVFAWVEGDTIHTESKFSGGKKVNQGTINVFDPAGHLLLNGKTDQNGVFSFKIPKIDDLLIELLAGAGHKSTWTVSASDMGGQASTPSSQVKADVPEKGVTSYKNSINQDELEAVIAKVMDQKLAPIKKELAASKNSGPDVRDILGGIGYIIGLVGLGAYMRFKKSTDSR